MPKLLLLLVAFLIVGGATSSADVVVEDNFDESTPIDNPWSCVDRSGQIKAIVGKQLAVDSSGNLGAIAQGPSVAIGDLNGDGLPDLVMADSLGFFWYFPNHGTPDNPKFTKGELMPIWLGEPPLDNPWQTVDRVVDNIVPRIQLIDLDGSGKLDLVVGNFLGKLYYFQNKGTLNVPVFKLPQNPDEIIIPTHREGKLWCNYLAPCLYDWDHKGVLDLVIGDGTYSANSIYLLKNKGSSGKPTFTEDTISKIIPGFGREILVPQVVSWNGDGKPDIICSEREGYLSLFLNQGTDPLTGSPKYDQGQHILIGGRDQRFPNSTVRLVSFSAKGPLGLIIGCQDGHILYAPNTGSAINFQFGTPVALTGTDMRPQILHSNTWHLWAGFGSPYDLLVCTDPQIEPGFTPPPDTSVKTALRFYIDEPAKPNPTFPGHLYPDPDTREIQRDDDVTLSAATDYKISFWVRTTGNISNLTCNLMGPQWVGPNLIGWVTAEKTEINSSETWSRITQSVRFESLSDDQKASVPLRFYFEFKGIGSLYLSQLKLETRN